MKTKYVVVNIHTEGRKDVFAVDIFITREAQGYVLCSYCSAVTHLIDHLESQVYVQTTKQTKCRKEKRGLTNSS